MMKNLTTERLATAILFILLFAMAVSVPLDTDTWWHLKSGEHVLDNGDILTQDVFSYTQIDQNWLNHSWGSQVIMAGMYRLTGGNGAINDGGRLGLALYTALLVTGGMAFLYRISTGNIYSKAFVIVLGAASAAIFWSPRPQLVSFFLSTVILYGLHQYKYHHNDRIAWGLIPLFILWGNLHAGYAIGIIFVVGFIIGEAVGLVLGGDDSQQVSRQRLLKLGGISLIAYAALIISPWGTRLWTYPLDTAGLQTLNLFIAEWLVPDFKNPQTYPFLLMLLGILTLSARVKQSLVWSEISLVVGTALMAFFAARNIAAFAVVATPVLAKLTDAYLREQGWKIRPNKKPVSGLMLYLNIFLLIVVLLGGLGKIATDLNQENVDMLQAEFLPLDGLAYLQDNPPDGNLLNNYNWGGLLIFTTPDIPVFVDGRTDLYGDDFLGDYFKTVLGASDWRDLLLDYDIQTVWMPPESAISTLLREDDNWQVVFEDDLSVILERQSE